MAEAQKNQSGHLLDPVFGGFFVVSARILSEFFPGIGVQGNIGQYPFAVRSLGDVNPNHCQP
jgi:hypothetical protein